MNSFDTRYEPVFPESGSDLGGMMHSRLPAETIHILESVAGCSSRVGIPAYAVGGPIRDLLLNRPVIDMDVVVEGDGIRFAAELASECRGKLVEYARFGTALVVMPGGIKVDVTTAREESYIKPGALPDVEPGTLEKDLFRRDFTINAMAIQLGPERFGCFIDLYGGISDLARGIIRVLHDGSFKDDPTRILRAIRFETRYGFTIEEGTAANLAESVEDGMLAEVSPQRLREEIVAILKEEGASAAVEHLNRSGVLSALFGDRFIYPDSVEDLFEKACSAADWYLEMAETIPLEELSKWRLRWLILMGGTAPEVTIDLSNRFHLGKPVAKAVGEVHERLPAIREYLSDGKDTAVSFIYRLMEGVSPEVLLYAAALAGRENTLEIIEHYLLEIRPIEAFVNGNNLKEIGVAEGPLMGEILRLLFDKQLDGVISSRNDAMEEARKLAHM